jgi:hypothetical protein
MVLSAGLYRQVTHYQREQVYAEQVLKQVGFYLATHVDRHTETVAAEDIGHIGYYSKCRILDRDGLVSPVAVSYNRDADYLGLILATRPEWVGITENSPISEFVADPRFFADYLADKAFSAGPNRTYTLYRRK